MATDKPRIQAFLEPELYQALTDWQQERGIPKNSEAINQILKEYFGLSVESPKFASPPNSEELRFLIQEELWGAGKSDFIDGLRAEAQAIIAKEVSEAKEYWQSLSSKELIEAQQIQINVLKERLESLEDTVEVILEEPRTGESNSPDEPQSPEPDLFQENGQGLAQPIDSKAVEAFKEDEAEESEGLSNSPSELNLSQLARHLKISKSVISRRKTRPDFEEWSKTQDPESKSWRYDPDRQIFRGVAL